MEYKCYCGATLKCSHDGKWFCPNGHPVYTCKKCEALGKNTPLQWVSQYQRWYCYECREYASKSVAEEKIEEEEDFLDEEEFLEEEKEVEVSGYILGIPRGSRVDEFCFMCKHLKFTQNNTHIKCGMNIPRFLEPAISEVTIRPTGASRGISGMCAQASFISDEDALLTLQEWREFIEKIVEKQIENHEDEAEPTEMYRIEFVGATTADGGANATKVPVSRDSIVGGRITVTIDSENGKIWVHAGTKKSGFLSGFAKVIGGIAGSMEDCFGARYLRDLLKRDIESFNVEKIWAGEEPPEFWQALDRAAREQSTKTHEQALEPKFEGPKIEIYLLKYHMGRAYSEYYTGGRSDTETKSITIEPLKVSIEELQSKRMVIVIDHQAKIVWHWIGKKSARLMKFFVKRIPSDGQSRKHHLGIIGSRIGQRIDDYDYIVVEESEEPEQFKRLFQT